MSDEQTLQDIKAGDTVIVRSSGYNNTLHKAVVTKITATQIVCGEDRYKRENGKELGTSGNVWARPDFLLPMTDELEKQYTRQQNLNRVKDFDFAKLDDATLQAVVDALKSAKKVEA